MSYSQELFANEAGLHISSKTICAHASPISIIEADTGGAGTILVTTDQGALKLSPNDLSIPWLVNQQCADGAVIILGNTNPTLHVFELKSKLSTQKWDDALAQCEGMIRRANALRASLGIAEYGAITFYLAYKVDALTPYIKANPVLLKSLLGKTLPDSSLHSWMNKLISIKNFPHVPVTIVARDEHGNGSIEIAA